MPELITFRNFHYKEAIEKGTERLNDLVAPPYDVISEEEKQELKERDPNNICHIILPESYEGAGKKLQEMIDTQTLVYGESRCLCVYGIDYERPDTGEKISRYGFVGLLKLEEIFPPSARKGIIPHEAVFKKFCEDRLQIIQNTNANFSPLFMIYDGNGAADEIIAKYTKKEPYLQAVDRDGFTHKIWEIWKEKDVKKLQKVVKEHDIIIADGHHRFITSLRHSKNGGCKYVMALFIDFNDPGLIIYTSHRELHQLPVKNLEEFKNNVSNYFNVLEINNYDELKLLMDENKKNTVFGCYLQEKYLFLKLKDEIKPEEVVPGDKSKEWKNLSLSILHSILIEKCLKVQKDDVTFVKDLNQGIERVNQNKIDALIIVNPSTLEEVQKITKLGEIMPQKSTYFFPKPLSGLLVHVHTDKIE